MDRSTAAVIIIGNEVLAGEVLEANAEFLIKRLRILGVRLKRVVVIPDEIDTVAEHVAEYSRDYRYVFTSGGIGPTHDDITLASIARAFDQPLVRHGEFERILRGAYGNRITERALIMADLPEGSMLEGSEDLRVPVVRVRNVYIFPGIPNLLREKFLAIEAGFRSDPFRMAKLTLLSDESIIADHVQQVQEAHPSVSIGSYPRHTGSRWEVTLSVESRCENEVRVAMEALLEGIPEDEILHVDRDGSGQAH